MNNYALYHHIRLTDLVILDRDIINGLNDMFDDIDTGENRCTQLVYEKQGSSTPYWPLVSKFFSQTHFTNLTLGVLMDGGNNNKSLIDKSYCI